MRRPGAGDADCRNGSRRVHTTRTLAKTSGGKGTERWNYGKHAMVEVRNVYLRTCMWNSVGTVCEGSAR